MAVYNFADFTGQTIAAFDVENDVLLIEAATYGSASAFTLGGSGNLKLTASNGQSVTLTGVSVYTISPSNVLFDDNSAIRAGDELATTDNDAVDVAQATVGADESDYIYGSSVTDNITFTGEFASYAQGAAGADAIIVDAASTGDHTVRGGAGDDVIDVAADAGDLVITGDLGADDLDITGDANVTANLGAGDDDISVSGGTAATTTFTRGGSDDDTFTLDAAAGTHTAWGDLGDDTFNVTGNADFVIYGDNLNNAATGGVDTINLSAGTGDHLFNGMAGADVINVTGGTGASTLRGGSGDDAFTVTGASGLSLRGDKGVDDFTVTLTAGQTITIEGGDGADTYTSLSVTGAAAVATISDFSSEDAVTLAGGVAASAGALTVDRDDDGVSLTNTASVVFSGYAGNFTADNLAAFTDGSVLRTNWDGAAATLTGTANNDLLIAGDNGDTLDGAGGNDQLTGGTGADTFEFATADFDLNDSVAGGTGTDVISMTDAATIIDTDFTEVTSVETLKLFNGANTVTVGDVALAAGVTLIDASAGTATTQAINVDAEYTGISVLGGAAVNNVTLAASGTHNIDLRAGIDSVTYTAVVSSGDVLKGGLGVDTLNLSNDAQSVSFGTNIKGFEVITTGDAVATTLTFSAAYNATIQTGEDLVITGGAGASALTLNASAVTVAMDVQGGEGIDTIVTGSGDDTIEGGLLVDVLTGGAGSDTFVYSANHVATADADTLKDFTEGDDGDIIGVTAADFGTTNFDAGFNDADTAANVIAAGTVTDGDVIVFTDTAAFANIADASAQVQAANAATLDYVVVFYNTTSSKVEAWFDNTSAVGGAEIMLATFDNLAVTDLADFTADNFSAL